MVYAAVLAQRGPASAEGTSILPNAVDISLKDF